jgi:amino acid adenylation domain-containing protein
MNSINELIDLLDSKGISLGLDGGDGLVIQGDRNHLDDSLIDEIRKFKSQIVSALRGCSPFALLTDEERTAYDEQYEDAYPMSALQAGMVFHTQLEQFSGIYHDIMTDHVKCPWNRSCFEQALSACILEYPILRTGFRLNGERPLQHVHKTISLPLTVEDLRGQTEAEQVTYLAQWTQARKRHVFDWERGPLFHIHIFRRSEDSFEFAISFHHAVLDGWSRAALTTALYNRYERLLSGQILEPVAPDHTYRDFIALEQQALADPQAKAHFAAMLENAPGLQLPRRTVTTGGYAQARHDVAGFVQHTNALLAMAQRLGVSVQALLLTAHLKVLALLGGQSRVLSCVTYNGRPEQLDAERGLGLFLNSLPLCLSLSTGSWKDLIMQVAGQHTTHMEYRRYPLAQIQQDIGRSFSEVLFNYTHFHVYNDLAQSNEQSLEALGSSGFEQTNFDLLVDIARSTRGDAMRLALVYNTHVFDPAMIAQWGTYYLRALESMLQTPEAPHAARSLLSEAERQVLLGGGYTAVDYPRDVCLHELIEAQVARSPDAIALVYEDSALTYRELDEQANQLAHYLRTHGVGPDSRVGLCVERSLSMVIGILGILKAGGAYVPLDPSYPADRLAYMLEHSAPSVVLIQASLEEHLPAMTVPVLRLDTEVELLSAYPTTPLSREELGLSPRHLAYVIYTSGSTGQPKGVMNEHAGVVNRLLWARDAYQLREDDRILQKTPFGFDVSVWELLLPLLSGARLVMAQPGGHMDPLYLAEIIDRERITTVHFVPSMLQVFLEHASVERCEGLRRVLCSGEALPYALQTRFLAKLPAVELHNLYGPTEAAIDVTSWICRGDVHEGIVPIGHPIANTQIYILDEHRQPVPMGVAGELYLGGAGVARGYLHREDLTTERFLDDPFQPGARVYKTGDLGRWLPDGAIEYLGRNDFQVKIRGFRIELGEIEARLVEHAAIREAIVLAREDEPGQKRLVAYLTLAASAAPIDHGVLIAELRDRLRAQLPEYMVPAALMVLEALPLTPNGKVDRKQLPAPDLLANAKAYVAPATDTQRDLAAIWGRLLKLDPAGISATANFFELGGHSLLSIRLVGEIRDHWQAELHVREMFEASDLVAMAALIEARRGTAVRIQITPVGRDNEYAPTSFAQQRLWFVDQLNGSTHYNMPGAWHVQGAFDERIAERTLRRIIERHETLRTVFVHGEQGPQQLIRTTFAFELVRVDMQSVAAEARTQAVREAVEVDALKPFHLGDDLMLRASFIRLSPQDGVLLVTMHHIASDGWSMGVLMQEFVQLYGAYAQGLSDPLAPLAIQYADYAQWQRDWLKEGVLDNLLSYWSLQLAGAPPVHALPLTGARPATQNLAGAVYRQIIGEQLTSKLKLLCQRKNVTFFMLMQTAFALLISRLSHENDVVIGTPIAGRSHAELDALIGFFVNNLALRSRFEANMPFDQALAAQKQAILQAYAHQHIPFETLVSHLKSSRSASYDPIFQIVFGIGLNGDARDTLSLPNLTVSPMAPESTLAKVDLELTVIEHADQSNILWTYRTDLFDAALIGEFAQSYAQLLQQIVENPHRGIFDYALLEGQRRDDLLLLGQGPCQAYPQDVCIHTQFEAQAMRTPEAIALRYEEQTLTYAQLNAKADRLARYLVDAGVERESRAGIYLSRSPELLIAVLGVLKAGGAYVPLEPGLPSERLRYMVQDADIGWALLTSTTMEGLPLHGVDVVLMDGAATDAAWLEPYARGDLPTVAATDLAYVIYTSGSTGKPKGVMVEHRSLSNYLAHAVNTYLPDVAGSVVSSPLCFDATLTTLLPPLLAGKPVWLLPDDEQILSRLYERLFAADEAWLFKITPAHLEALSYMERGSDTGTAAHRIVVGGEQLAAATVRRWKGKLLPQAVFINEYGPTETVVGCSVWTLASDHQLTALNDAVAAPIGCAIGNTQLYVLGPGGQLQPTGSVGELYIGGDGVTRGYLNQPALTQERFIANPFGAGRLYKTGDLVRYVSEGELEFIGRIDDQVKIRGFRIELGEIEGQLRQRVDVREAVVLAREDEPGQKRLVAYVVPAEWMAAEAERATQVNAYREGLSAALPDYMVPAIFVLLDALPLTPNGKVDKRALPAPDGHEGEAVYVAPRNAVEEALCTVWAEVLKRERVGVQDNFFSLGGDSILSIRIVSLLKQRGLAIDIKDLFQHQTIALLALRIEQHQTNEDSQVNTRQVMQVLMHELDELNEGDIEAVL